MRSRLCGPLETTPTQLWSESAALRATDTTLQAAVLAETRCGEFVGTGSANACRTRVVGARPCGNLCLSALPDGWSRHKWTAPRHQKQTHHRHGCVSSSPQAPHTRDDSHVPNPPSSRRCCACTVLFSWTLQEGSCASQTPKHVLSAKECPSHSRPRSVLLMEGMCTFHLGRPKRWPKQGMLMAQVIVVVDWVRNLQYTSGGTTTRVRSGICWYSLCFPTLAS